MQKAARKLNSVGAFIKGVDAEGSAAHVNGTDNMEYGVQTRGGTRNGQRRHHWEGGLE